MNAPTLRSLPKPAAKPPTRPEPPTAPVAVNLHKPSTEGHVQLQFQVPADIRRAVKAYAVDRDMTNSELFLKMWEFYRANNV